MVEKLEPKHVIFAVSSILMLSYLLINIYIRQSAFNDSLKFIYDFQTNYNTSFITFFFNIAANLVNPAIVVGFLVVVFIFTDKKVRILNFLVYFAFMS